MQNRPNILIMIPHDLGDHLHCYGHKTVRSPNLDKMAAEGVKFTNCFTIAPECAPSRGGTYTGYYPHQNGLMGLPHFGWKITNEDTPHIAKRLMGIGYETYLFGFQHETYGSADEVGEHLGYCHVVGGENSVQQVCSHVNDFLNNEAEEIESPWFACAGFSHTHRPWPENKDFDPNSVEIPQYLLDTPVIREDMACFHQSIYDMDTAVGEVLNTLRRKNMGDNTLVIFITDHGIAFPKAKASFYDAGLNIAVIMWGLDINIPGGEDVLFSNIDIAPTLMELAGIDIPKDMPGRSLLPLLQGGQYKPRDAVYGALHYDVAYDPMHYVRTKEYKYIRSFAVSEEDAAGADKEVLTSFAGGHLIRVDDFDVLSSPTWQEMKDKVSTSRPCMEELYCLQDDPYETENLVDSTEHQETLQKMRDLMQKMMKETSSPLLNGHVQPNKKQRKMAKKYAAYDGEMYKKRGL